jgi:transposase-like protein
VPLDYQSCLSCGSQKIVKHGILHNQSGDLQRYSCKACGKRFTMNLGFEKMGASPQAITSAMQLYFTGESLRNVQKFLRLQGVNVSHVSVYNWIGKYVGLMQKYLDTMTPKVSDTWRADELWVKIKGDMKYLFAMMDDETRFWIAQEVADTKKNHDARGLFYESTRWTDKVPETLITDGLGSYHQAWQKVFNRRTWSDMTPKHIREIRLAGKIHNNKMERMNGEVRDREKVMRGLKKSDTPILKEYQLYHNFIRPHEALDGETPADRCGIKVEGSNKWLTIIQNASHRQGLNNEGSP